MVRRVFSRAAGSLLPVLPTALRAGLEPIPAKGVTWLCATLLLLFLGFGAAAQAAAPCERCHRSTVSFTGARMDHTGITDSCSRCHNGVQATGKPRNHVVTAQACETCHFSTFSFEGGSMNHAGIAGNCASCHNGLQAPGKSANHVPTTLPCEQCHRPTQFVSLSGAKMDHTGIVANCSGCHGGAFADTTTKTATHVPTTQDCSVCHRSTASFAQALMDHSGITGNCAQCHGGQYPGVTGKTSVNHIPTSASCETCHNPAQFTGFAGARMDHNGAGITVGSGACNQCHDSSASFSGVTDKRPPATFQVCPPPLPENHIQRGSCDQSGCHGSTRNWTIPGYCGP